jgi:hypothetical protein
VDQRPDARATDLDRVVPVFGRLQVVLLEAVDVLIPGSSILPRATSAPLFVSDPAGGFVVLAQAASATAASTQRTARFAWTIGRRA